MDQWNVTAPPLYLWSCREWSAKHKAIAQKHGHLFSQQERSNLEKNHFETETPDPVNGQHSNAGALILAGDIPLQSRRPQESNCGVVNDGHEGWRPCNNGDRESQNSHGLGTSHCNETSRKKRQGEKKVERGMVKKSLEGRHNGGKKHSVSDSYNGVHHPSPPKSRSAEKPSPADISENCYKHLDPSLSGSYTQHHGTPYGGSSASIQDDMNRRHKMNNHDPYLLEIHGLSSGGNMEEQFTRCIRDGTLGSGYRSYVKELERESDRQSQVRLYGQDADSVEGNYLSGRDLGYGHMGPALAIPYGHLGSAPEPSYMMNMSAMQRYAPRLDELNHTRRNNLGPEPSQLNRSGIYDPRAPGAEYQFGSMGFAPGHHPYSHRSAGWLNE
ncbi:unnamed protein product [Dovyalis caffra]|uniref:DM2 domain-containing protein n=1 Tax=Dovyalis caffra TaxID=77055 RepID=A0AAV1QWS5_9ROSI|nr:unnamed protein product [Dovyalis caffra]